MFTAKSTALYALVACLVLLCGAPCTLPAAAQGDAANPSRTFRFLQAFAASIPQLSSSWTGTDYCSWSGVSCDDASAGTGVRIALSGIGLRGQSLPAVPDGTDDVSVLVIDLSNNVISAEAPTSWSALTLLESLDLSNTGVFGMVPDEWSEMNSLRNINISSTSFYGSLPNWEYDKMQMLEVIDFSYCGFDGLSSVFGTFSASTILRSFDLNGNVFCGCIPDSWTSDLLRNAAISATPALGNDDCLISNSCDPTGLPSLTAYTLKFLQSFAESIPELKGVWTGSDYCTWDGVTCENVADGTNVRVDLSSRDLTGELPDTPDGKGDLFIVTIDLSNNTRLGGGFRDSWSALNVLKLLDLSSTAMFGSIPDAWNGMHSLRNVYISNTGACRALPNWNFNSIQLLEEVDFSNNALKVLSSSFGTFSNSTVLTSLNLNDNTFCFCLPDTWTSALLRNAAVRATPAVGEANCGSSNRCTNGELNVCGVTNGATFTTFYTTMIALFLTCLIVL